MLYFERLMLCPLPVPLFFYDPKILYEDLI